MKRHPSPTRIIAVGLLCAFIGCSKENPVSSPAGNKEEAISTATILKTAKGNPTIGLQTRIGHKKGVCDGSCTSAINTHMDCAGTGSECNLVGNIELEPPLGKGTTEPPHIQCPLPLSGRFFRLRILSHAGTLFLYGRDQTMAQYPSTNTGKGPSYALFLDKKHYFYRKGRVF